MIRRPAAILALLTGLNFLNYLDRFVVAAVLPRITSELGLSNFEGGLLATAFLLGYFATAPIFGALADRGPRKGLIALGVLTWSLATLGSGMVHGLAALLAVRAVVGLGEASYATLAPTIIDDLTPPEKKGRALAIFFLATPLGSALGYLVGGFVEKRYGWRAAFYVGGGPGVVLALACLAIAEPPRQLAVAKARVLASARTLLRLPLYRRTILGYCAHTAAIGGFAYWAPRFLEARYALPLHTADFWVGTLTVVAGAIGTIVGGRLADRAIASGGTSEAPDHDSPANRRAIGRLLKICAIGVTIAAPLAVLAFAAPSPVPFFALIFGVEVGLFLSTAPVNAILLRSVPPALRASAMALAIFAIHLLGDLWSPPGIGLLQDVAPIVLAMMALPVLVAVAAWTWWPRRAETGEAG
jgi:MFS family permease